MKEKVVTGNGMGMKQRCKRAEDIDEKSGVYVVERRGFGVDGQGNVEVK